MRQRRVGPLEHRIRRLAADGSLTRIVAADDRGRLIRWDTSDSEPEISLRTEGEVTDLVPVSADEIVTGHRSGAVVLTDLRTPGQTHKLLDSRESVGALAWDPSRRQLAVGGGDGQVVILALADPQGNQQRIDHDGRAAALAFSHDGRSLAIGGDAQVIAVHDLLQGGNPYELAVPRLSVQRLAFSPDGMQLAAACHPHYDPAVDDVRDRVHVFSTLEGLVANARSSCWRMLTAEEFAECAGGELPFLPSELGTATIK